MILLQTAYLLTYSIKGIKGMEGMQGKSGPEQLLGSPRDGQRQVQHIVVHIYSV